MGEWDGGCGGITVYMGCMPGLDEWINWDE